MSIFLETAGPLDWKSMMPSWTSVPLDYERRAGSNVFVIDKKGFDASSIGKKTPASTGRQKQFEDLVNRIAQHLKSRTVPVFVAFKGEQRRMDKGCVGFAIERGFLGPLANGPEGYVTHVTLKRMPT